MGFLGFLSRKQPPTKEKDDEQLKAQPYAATTASEPPIRGTVPVTGNGPIVFPNARQHVHGDYQSLDGTFLVPPPGDDDAERPRTAPSSPWPLPDASRAVSGSSASLVPKAKPLYRLPDKGSPGGVPDQVYVPTHPPKQPSQLSLGANLGKLSPSRQRAVSIDSVQFPKSPAFIDILDAQAGINPTNFRDRVRAAGARDYGEDVADRNVGSNGSFLEHLDESRGPSSLPPGLAKPTTESSRLRTNDTADELPGWSRNRGSLVAGLRSRSFTAESSQVDPFSHYAEASAPTVSRTREGSWRRDGASASDATKAGWRKSMPSYLTAYVDDEPVDIPEMPRLSTRRDETDQDLGYLKVRDQKRDDETKSLFHSAPSLESIRQRTPSNSAKAPSKRLSSHSMSKRLSSHSMQKPAVITFNDKMSHVRHDSSASECPDIHQFDFDDLTLVGHRPSSMYKGSQDGFIGDWNQSRSLLSASGKSFGRFVMDDVIPDRSSSLRPGSRGSTSATSASSNPFRPQSRHTANTSVDLTPALFQNDNSSLDSLKDVPLPRGRKLSSPFSIDSIQRNLSSPPAVSVQKEIPQPTFNIDDYISSDEDLDRPRSFERKDEEHLLFSDTGYGMGFELPGISGQFAPKLSLPGSPQKSSGGSRRHRGDLESTGFNDVRLGNINSTFAELRVESRSHHRFQFRMSLQNIAPAEDHGWMSEDDDSEEELSFDIPMTRMDSTLRQYRAARYAALEEETIVEEKESGKMDVKALMRMRKAANKAKRLSSTSIGTVRSRSVNGKGKDVPFSKTVDSADYDTDVE